MLYLWHITGMDSCSSCLWSWSSPAPRPPSCSATSTCVRRWAFIDPNIVYKSVKCSSRQDYHWWWRSFLTSGFTAFYFAVYCIHYFFTKLDIEDSASTFLYFGYTSIMVFCFFLLTGILEMIFRIRILFPSFHTNFRNNWLLCMLLVCEENLQRCESRLDDNFYLTWTIFRKFLTYHVRNNKPAIHAKQ